MFTTCSHVWRSRQPEQKREALTATRNPAYLLSLEGQESQLMWWGVGVSHHGKGRVKEYICKSQRTSYCKLSQSFLHVTAYILISGDWGSSTVLWRGNKSLNQRLLCQASFRSGCPPNSMVFCQCMNSSEQQLWVFATETSSQWNTDKADLSYSLCCHPERSRCRQVLNIAWHSIKNVSG